MKVINRLVKRIGYAWQGIRLLVCSQENARIHAGLTLAVVGVGLWLPLTNLEWVALLLVTGMVWTAEALNTAIEYHVDDTSPEQRQTPGQVKDLAAGAVLFAGFTAVLTGILILGPHLMRVVF
jgi:diacylglycerol kinase (ATP)